MQTGERGWGTTFFRFLLSGAGNTAASYVVYLALLNVFSYRVSYTLAYASGIIIAYLAYRFYVFRTTGGRFGLVFVCAIYLLQYLLGLTVVYVWVEFFAGPALFAPLVAVAVTIPVTFVLNRLVFRKTKQPAA